MSDWMELLACVYLQRFIMRCFSIRMFDREMSFLASLLWLAAVAESPLKDCKKNFWRLWSEHGKIH
jgi:hypothetical protein